MHDARSAKFSDLLALLVLFTLVLWFCQDLIVSDQVPFFRDLGNYFYPLRFSFFQGYSSGELPLWDRHFAMGFPMLAAFQSGVFYPPHFLLLVFPFFAGIRALFVLHFLIAASGAYALFRHWKYPSCLSIIAALLFTFGGAVVSLTNLLNHFQTAVWLPWLILCWETTLRVTSWRNFLIFAVVASLQLLAGSPELFFLSMGVLLIDGLRVRYEEPEISYKKIIGILLTGNLLVVALTMAQLLPTAELFLQSRRQHPMHPQEAFYWSLNPMSLLNLFFLDKEVDLNTSIGTRLFFAREAAFFISYYLGAISLLGVCLWLCSSSTREKVALGSLVLVSITLALGSYTPVYPFLFNHVPFMGVLRFPEKFFFLIYVLLLFAAIRGIGELMLRHERNSKLSFIVLALVCLTWLGVYLYLRLSSDLLSNVVITKSNIAPFSDAHSKAMGSLLANVERQLALTVGCGLLLALARARMIRLSLCGILLVASVYVDLAWAHRSFLLPLNPAFVNQPGVMRVPDSEPNRIFYYPPVRNLHPSFVSVLGRPTFKQAQALSFHNLLPNAGVLYGFDYMQEMDALGRQPYTDFLLFANRLDFQRQLQLLRSFNVKYLMTLRPMAEEGVTLIGEFPSYFSWLYRIENSVARAYVVNDTVVETDSNEILRRLSSLNFDPTRTVVVDEKLPIEGRRPVLGTATILRYENQIVTIQTISNGSAVLVLADSHYPGWKAYVDGKEEVIRRANLFFRAVPVPAGNHMVEFRYEPWSFKIGQIVSLVTVLFVIITSIIIAFTLKRPIRNTAAMA
jgi:hypothetical protein